MSSVVSSSIRALALSIGISMAATAAPDAAQAADGGSLEAYATLRQLEMGALSASPDERSIAYKVTNPDLAANTRETGVYVRPLSGGEERRIDRGPGKDAGSAPTASELTLVWTPDSRGLVYAVRKEESAEVGTFDLATGARKPLLAADRFEDGYELGEQGGATPLQFSPDGEWLALSVPTKVPGLNPDFDVEHAVRIHDRDLRIYKDTERNGVLFALHLASGRLLRLSDPSLDVQQFEWSPDSNRLVFAARDGAPPRDQFVWNSDLYLVGLDGGKAQALLVQEGQDDGPKWSPDGRSIAFASSRGKIHGNYQNVLTVIEARPGAQPRYIGQELGERYAVGARVVGWSPDSGSVYVAGSYNLGRHMFRLDAQTGAVERFSPDDGHSHEDAVLLPRSGRFLLANHTLMEMPDVHLAQAAPWKEERLTDFNPAWRASGLPEVEQVTWKSRDGRWELNGMLVKPRDFDPKRKYPLVVQSFGGPSMVFRELFMFHMYPMPWLAQNDYLVFLPNSRGRAGYGYAFESAIRDERSYQRNGAYDVIDGVNALIERGFVDENRLAIQGFSYGGGQTAMVVTIDDRFKAAIYGEGTVNLYQALESSTRFHALNRDMWGYDIRPEALFGKDFPEYAYKESSLSHLASVRTPMMIETGEQSLEFMTAWDQALFRGLQSFGVPSEWYVIPRHGHGWSEPKLLVDAYRRHIEWLQYWLDDKPMRDPERQRGYDAWKRERAGK